MGEPRVATATPPGELNRRFELLEQLGAGGMGTVHKARERASGRLVALKQLHVLHGERSRARLEAMFEREYHTLARLRHPRAIEVYEYGRSEAGPYYTMELLGGSDLQSLAPLPAIDVCRYLRDVASMLALLHTHRLVHRDVSPRNVRLGADGRAKLIDFGALHAFGVASEVVGTAPCVAPELLTRMPLEPRADLFSLGAVAYWALTRRHAYPARRVEELPELWRHPPPPPSHHVAGIPPALDALVMSLLSIDPLSRPSSSAELIDRLTAIGGLPPEEHERTEESYLGSSRMVGRALEMGWLDKHLNIALQGQGLPVVLEGGPGMGKTRLMHEFGLHAQLRGASVLRADAGARAEAYGVATQLGLHLLALCPEAARLAEPHADVLAHLDPGLRTRLCVTAPSELPAQLSERRARIQHALHSWFLAAAQQWRLVILVDDVHAADDNSAAFLASLAQQARSLPLLLLCTLDSGATPAAEVPVKLLRKGSAHLKLGALDADATREFVASIFGVAQHQGALAALLLQRSGGNPQLCVDLVTRLVRSKIAKYAGGTWLLPPDLSAEELPARSDDLIGSRLASLSAEARTLANALCVHRKPLSLELCVALANAADGAATNAALDQLLADQVLIQNENGYRFAHEALRELLLQQLAPDARRAAHLHAGEALLTRAGDDVITQVAAAQHLLSGGQEQRAITLLSNLSRAYLRLRIADDDPEEIVHALHAAILICERDRKPPEFSADLLMAMMVLAFYSSSDWRLIRRYGERAVALGMQVTGLARARSLKPWLGERMAVAAGLGAAALQLKRLRKRGLQYDLKQAIELLCGMLPALHGTFALCHDTPACERLAVQIEPLTYFGKDHLVMVAYDYCAEQLAWLHGRLSTFREGLERSKTRVRDPRVLQTFGQEAADFFYGAVLWPQGLLDASGFGRSALAAAAELDTLGGRWFANAADQIRMLYHTTRGESEEAARFRERIELFAMQGGSTWQLHLVAAPIPISLDVRIGDAIAARRNAEHLARLASGIPSLRPHAAAAEAGSLALRGQLEAAIAAYERVLPDLPPGDSLYWLAVRASYAQALNWAGEHARARSLMREALDALERGCETFTGDLLAAHAQLAVAEASLGRHAQAIALLEPLLERHGAEDHPLFVGGLHQARAEVALQMNDAAQFAVHFEELERRYRRTRNPALIAQCERLAERAIAAGVRARPSHSASSQSSLSAGPETSARGPLGQLSAAADPYQVAVAMLVERTRARRGYLYLFESDALRLMAASSPQAPPPEVEDALLQNIRRELFEAQSEAQVETATYVPPDAGPAALSQVDTAVASGTPSNPRTRIVDLPAGASQLAGFQLHLLRAGRSAGPSGGIVGGVILEAGRKHRAPNEAWLDAIAAELADRHPTTAASAQATLAPPQGVE